MARLTWLIEERGIGILTGEVGAGKTVAARAITGAPSTSPIATALIPPPWPSRLSRDLDLELLARAFRLSGGNIQNILVAATYAAAEDAAPSSMSHLMRATQRECRKLGRIVVESEFGPYFGLVR